MPRAATTIDPVKSLQRELQDFKSEVGQRLATLESERPGRKPKPLLAYKERDICGIDPDRDSHGCPDASIYRYQSGCWGAECRLKQHQAYKRRQTSGSRRRTGDAVAVPMPKKRTPAKATTGPAKRTIKAVKTPTKAAPKTTRAPKVLKEAAVVTTATKRPTKRVAKAS